MLSGVQWRILALLFISSFLNYVDRSNLSVGATDIQRELGFNSYQLGLLLSAFFLTYATSQLFMVAGWFVDRFDVKWVFAIGFFIWSGATAVTGLVHGFAIIYCLRLLLGMGESISFPSYSRILATQYPEHHRGLANAIVDAGTKTGPALGTLLGGLLMAQFGWRSFFVALGPDQPALADSVVSLDAEERAARGRRRTAAQGAGRHPRDPEQAVGMVQRVRTLLLELLLVFSGDVAARISRAGAEFPEIEDGSSSGRFPTWPSRSRPCSCGWLSDRLIARGAQSDADSQDLHRHRAHALHDHSAGGGGSERECRDGAAAALLPVLWHLRAESLFDDADDGRSARGRQVDRISERLRQSRRSGCAMGDRVDRAAERTVLHGLRGGGRCSR